MIRERIYYVLSDAEKQWFLISSNYISASDHELTDEVYEAKRFQTKEEALAYIEDFSVHAKYRMISKIKMTITIE